MLQILFLSRDSILIIVFLLRDLWCKTGSSRFCIGCAPSRTIFRGRLNACMDVRYKRLAVARTSGSSSLADYMFRGVSSFSASSSSDILLVEVCLAVSTVFGLCGRIVLLIGILDLMWELMHVVYL